MTATEVLLLDQILAQHQDQIPSSLTISQQFEYFAAEEIFKDLDLSSEEILAGQVGGGDDGGIDNIYVFANESLLEEDSSLEDLNSGFSLDLHVIQSKTSPSFAQTPIVKLTETLRDLLDLSRSPSKSVYSENLLERVEIFRRAATKAADKFPVVRVCVYYVTKGNTSSISRNVTAKRDHLVSEIGNLEIRPDVHMDLMGARELLDITRKEPSFTLELPYKNVSALGDSYVAMIKISAYADFLSDEGGKLRKYIFDSNVRDFQGNTKVNAEIKRTLDLIDVNPPDFWWLNNGVTILTNESSIVGQKFIIKNPQIVNGLQTSIAIYERQRSDPESLKDDDRSILVRVIMASDDDVRNKIIVATNSQTNLDPSAIRAADVIQRDIEQYFLQEGWYYDRRKNFYRNLKKPVEKIISIQYLSQAVLSAGFGEPNSARSRPSALIKDNSQYARIFDSSISLEVYLWVAKLQKEIDRVVRGSDLESNEKSNVKFHLTTMVVRAELGSPVRHPSHLIPLLGREISEASIKKQLKVLMKASSDYQKTQTDTTLDKIFKSSAFVKFLDKNNK